MPEINFPIAVVLLLLGGGIGFFIARRAGPAPGELQRAREDVVRAETNLQNLQTQFDREKSRLEEIRSSMENTFKAMAGDIAASNTRVFLEQATEKFRALAETSEKQLDGKRELIDKTLRGMSEHLDSLRRQSVELKTSIDQGRDATNSLSAHTAHLREILSSSQKRGQWGERMVTDILQVIGLLEGKNYTRQSAVESGKRPDFTFILPRGKKLNMDVKFPLDNYERYIAAAESEDGGAGEQAKLAFMRDVKNHISSVSGREYINPAEGTLDYVMLFIPNESIYGFINSEDSKLVDFALSKRVLLCSPLTLYAVLSLIHQATRNFIMNERASEVMDLVAQFRAQWEKYSEQMDKLGRRIEGLSGDYRELVNTRARALQRPLDKIENAALAQEDIAEDAIARDDIAGGESAPAAVPELLPRRSGEI
ncbi:MAG: DNA recombination protein RmuC [Gammaproteobacteria bacterium]|nr:DNA recombination protein RmuC [Gammaproteobacteria bacterium]MDA7961206.1 DNA recombination protein RmuC [Gammaproteobacteria bacterium]MDA7970853.1 DNA recombination protein RmuC [Gammaproteobacteria bacterium]MDA7994691.1 DNA recombination protein RmuC [Gammaproteobacteria bacterium]MDA8023246.1 DNA recombination protein RmuC [Gammaproteobacteria bacterium]